MKRSAAECDVGAGLLEGTGAGAEAVEGGEVQCAGEEEDGAAEVIGSAEGDVAGLPAGDADGQAVAQAAERVGVGERSVVPPPPR